MLEPFNSAPYKCFYPWAKAPARYLTQDLPPSMDANVLHISNCDSTLDVLYTIHRESSLQVGT